MRIFFNRMLGGRSVAAWTVIGGISGLAALIVAIFGFNLVRPTSSQGGASDPQSTASSKSNTVATSPQVEASLSRSEGKVYLDQLEPIEAGDFVAGPRVMNRTTYQRSLTPKGGGCRHASHYNVYREYQYVRATIGLEDTAETGSRTIFIVVADDREIFNSGELKLGDVRQIEVPIKNVFRLTLKVDNLCVKGEGVWGDVHLVK